MRTREISREERIELCGGGVTLNGRPAVVQGWARPFAKVVQRASGLAAEWSWETVDRIVAAGGAFQT